MSNIKFKGASIPIAITYKQAMFDFPEDELYLLNIFQDGQTVSDIMTNDSLMINIWYRYVSPHCTSLENAVEDLTPEEMNQFRDAFWEAVLNFINPQMRPALQELKTMLMEQLSSPGTNLRRALSVSLDEPESTPPSSPLEKSSS